MSSHFEERHPTHEIPAGITPTEDEITLVTNKHDIQVIEIKIETQTSLSFINCEINVQRGGQGGAS